INALVFKLFGASDYTGRIAAATFGVLLMAMPLLIRHKLGKAGTLIAVAFISFSPALLYFSRFTREDIYMMVFVLGMVIGSYRFVEQHGQSLPNRSLSLPRFLRFIPQDVLELVEIGWNLFRRVSWLLFTAAMLALAF